MRIRLAVSPSSLRNGLAVTALVTLLSLSPVQAATLHVKKDAPGPAHDGATWATAFTTIQSAFSAAASGDEVWVALGDYYVGAEEATGEREPVTLKKGVALYGGFKGTETARSERVLDARLSGGVSRIHRLDTPTSPLTSVVLVETGAGRDTVLDGFTISGGRGTRLGVFRMGGGIFFRAASPTIRHNVIRDNGVVPSDPTSTADTDGGLGAGIYCDGAGTSPLIANNLIYHNRADRTKSFVVGGAVCIWSTDGVPEFINNTVVENISHTLGATLVELDGRAINNIIAFNTRNYVSGAQAMVFNANCVYNGAEYNSYPSGGTGNITVDPGFVDRANGDYRLKPNSPCVNTGDNAAVSPEEVDLDGQPRIRSRAVDMGAYETPYNSSLYVKHDAPGPDHNGKTWDTAFLTVQEAVNAASKGDEIWVAAGAYMECIITTGRHLYGGFAGTETWRDQRDFRRNVTVLQGGTRIWDHDSDIVYGSVVTVADAVIDGFTIRGGVGNGYDSMYPSAWGGGISASGTAVIRNNFITENRASAPDGWLGRQSGRGGGIACKDNVIVEHNAITNNGASDSGGGIVVSAPTGNVLIVNNFIADNHAYGGFSSYGGGIDVYGQARIVNNTIVRNTADSCAGVNVPSTAALVNTIVAFNNGVGIGANPSALVSHCAVFGNTGGDVNGGALPPEFIAAGCISADPLFIAPNLGHFGIELSSPAKDAGDDAAPDIGDTDLSGGPRIQGAHVDMGAYEAVRGRLAFRVKHDAAGSAHDGLTWETAFRTVQEGIDAASVADEVLVAAGTYRENVVMRNGVQLYGGFTGLSDSEQAGNPKTNITILNGSQRGSVVTLGPSFFNPVRIDGFTIQAGYGTEVDNRRLGGGIYAKGVSATIANNTITANYAGFIDSYNALAGDGGGLYAEDCTLTIRDNTITANVAGWYNPSIGLKPGNGGGLYFTGCKMSVLGNTIRSNRALASGGGLYIAQAPGAFSFVEITGNNISSNQFSASGGGVYCESSATVMYNRITGNAAAPIPGQPQTSVGGIRLNDGYVFGNVIARNRADVYSGILCGGYILNNTVVENHANKWGAISGSPGQVTNNIVAFNTGYGIGSQSNNISQNDIYANTPANWDPYFSIPGGMESNTSVDPLFVDRVAGDYHLLSGSPCIDAGANLWFPGQTDLDGNPRIQGPLVDMGAYEVQSVPLGLPDVLRALQVAAGLDPSGSLSDAEMARLNVSRDGASRFVVDVADGVLLLRYALIAR